MKTLKKYLSVMLTITTILSAFVFVPINTNAKENTFSAQYIGSYDESGGDFKLDIYSVNKNNNSFDGHIFIETDLVKIDKDITGTVEFYDEYYTCSFMVSYKWLTTYQASFRINIYPHEGTAHGEGGGGMLFASTDIQLTGTDNYRTQQRSISYE